MVPAVRRDGGTGSSPTYERLALAISDDEEVLALLATLPPHQRQPNTLFAVVRLLNGPIQPPSAFREFVVGQWPAVAAEMMTRATQTNEPGRCALLLPVLAALPQPVALIEVGASAGLCLYLDKYTYRYGEHVLGDGGLVLDCTMIGIQPPTRRPEVVWRAGLDINPLDVSDPSDLAWLDALIWPEHTERRERLHRAAAILAADPPQLVRGDLETVLPSLIAQAPIEATLVVFQSSVLYRVRPTGAWRSWTSCGASTAPTGSPSRHRMCCPTPISRHHPIPRFSTCSRSTRSHWPGPAATGKDSCSSALHM